MKNFKYLISILLIYHCFFSKSQVCNISELDKIDTSELDKIRGCLDQVMIVGMGESTHGTHEFFHARSETFKYLVQNLDFNTFYLEADFANCLPINDYIHGGDGDAVSLVKGIGLWPWITFEMVELIEWMREYNSLNQNTQLSFVGVDVQKISETISTILELAQPNSSESLKNLKNLTNQEFYKQKKGEIKKTFEPVIAELTKMDFKVYSVDTMEKLEILIKRLNQIIECQISSESSCRDFAMAENLLSHLKLNERTKGFFWAHNMHIANFYNEKKKSGVAGGLLKSRLREKYFSIGQEFFEGAFNVYYKDSQKGSKNNIDNFTFGSVQVGPAAEGSFAKNFEEKHQLPVFIPFTSLPITEEVNITNIGASYLVNDDPKSIWRYNHHGRKAFDAILLIRTSTPTKLLIND